MKRENKKKRKNQKGFTLVEMIVVIAIIGVLATMMVPSLLGFVDKAHISNNNATAAGIGRGVQAILAGLSDAEVDGVYNCKKIVDKDDDGVLKIQISSGSATDGQNKFITEFNNMLQEDKFPIGSSVAIEVTSGKLENVTYQKKGTSVVAISSSSSKEIGIYTP